MKLIQKIQQFGPFFVALMLVVSALLVVSYSQKQTYRDALEKESQVLLNALSNEVTANLGHLSSLQRFFISSNFVDRSEFKSFVGPVLDDHSYLSAITWIPQITQEQRQNYIELAHKDGLSDFSIKRWQPSLGWKSEVSPWAKNYFPIFYVEPLKSNLPALGIDLGSNRQRRKAIDLALKTKTPIASKVIELAQGGKAVLVFLSIHNDEANAINTRQTKGLMSLVFKASNYFKEVTALQGEDFIHLTVRENDPLGNVLYDSEKPLKKPDVAFQTVFPFMNQNWHFHVTGGTGFYALYSSNLVPYVLIAGLIFLMLIFRYNLSIISNARQSEGKVASVIRDIGIKEAFLDYMQIRQKIIVDLMTDAVITIDHEDIIEEFNPAAEAMFGYQKKDISGRNIKCLMPESFSHFHDSDSKNHEDTGIKRINNNAKDALAMHKDGTVFPVNLNVSEHKTGDTSMFVGILRNLTEEQKRQAEQLALSKQLESILDSTREGICGIGADGLIRFANRSAENMLGYEMNGLDGFDLNHLIFDQSSTTESKEVVSSLKQALADGKDTAEGTELVVTTEGRSLSISFSLCSTRDKSDESAGYVLVFRDNTQSLAATKLIEQQHHALETANVELSRANKDIEQFAYVASHDLKAPLRGISNLAAWVCEDLGDALAGESLENMTLLRNRIARLDNLLTDLLAYSRAGQVSEENQELNTATIIQDLVELQGVPNHVEVVVADDLPVIFTNRVAFDLIVRNLFSNAVKHAGRQAVRIEISAEKRDSETVFSIEDNGPGIKQEDHERIFELFTKLQSSDDVEGSGMGLSICRRTVDRIGGRLWVDPEITTGARFAFSIPTASSENES